MVSLESKEGSNQAGGGHRPLDRWKGQTKLADGMVRWTDGKGSNQAGGGHRPLDRRKG